MQTFTAEEFNKSPGKVYRSADKDGVVKINHDRYPDLIFTLVAHDRSERREMNCAES